MNLVLFFGMMQKPFKILQIPLITPKLHLIFTEIVYLNVKVVA